VSTTVNRPSPEASTLAGRAYLAIRDRIVLLDLAPGAPIDDARLAEELEVGRTPIREALKRLEAERLVVAYPRRGTFTTQIDVTDLAHLTRVRAQLEPLAASLAAEHATAGQRARLADLRRRLEDEIAATDFPGSRDMLELDMQVHRAIYSATGNPFLEDTLTQYDAHATRIWCLFLGRLGGFAGHVSDHVDLLRAIEEGAAERAGQLARAHVDEFEAAVRAVI
jgi:DNA-binding GntR family transcriptional regulator